MLIGPLRFSAGLSLTRADFGTCRGYQVRGLLRHGPGTGVADPSGVQRHRLHHSGIPILDTRSEFVTARGVLLRPGRSVAVVAEVHRVLRAG